MRVVHLIGDITEEGPRLLAGRLVDKFYVVSNMPDPNTDLIFLCVCHHEVDARTWEIIDKNPQATIVPTLFNGARTPAIFCHIRGLNFSDDFEGQLQLLISAVDSMVEDR